MGFGPGAFGPSPYGASTPEVPVVGGVPNTQYGHQLDADTLLLYRNGEPSEFHSNYTGTVADEAGLHPLTISGNPQIVDGPAGLDRQTFARWFYGSADQLRIGSIDDTFRQHLVEGGGEYTLEVLARPDISGAFREVFNIFGSGEGASGDFLVRMAGTIGGGLELFWERSGANQQISTGGVQWVGGEWTTFHAVFTTRTSDRWTVNVYRSVAGDIANLIGTYDADGEFAQGSGLKPGASSGTAAAMEIGVNWAGAVGSVRIVNKAMSLSEIQLAGTQLTQFGDVNDGLTALAHWRLNEPPDLIDETAFGFHARANGWSSYRDRPDPADPAQQFMDLVGTGGRARATAAQTVTPNWRMDQISFVAEHGREFYQYFNNDIDTVPTYTLEAWLLYPARTPGLVYLFNFIGSGESLATNYLFRFGIASGLTTVDFFAESGGGVNITAAPATVDLGAQLTDGGRYGKFHYAVRAQEKSGFPGTMEVDHFINGVLAGTYEMSAVPEGGSSSNIQFQWSGWIQDIKVSRIARTDQEILDDSQRTAFGGP